MAALKSPRTGKELTVTMFGDIELDVDDETGGVWLDAPELDQLTDWFHEGDSFSALAEKHAGALSHDTVDGACPRCATKTMKEYPMPLHDGSSLTLDICETCKGLWVDGPELAPIRNAMLQNKSADFQSRIQVDSGRSMFMRMLYPAWVKNMVERSKNS